MKQDAELHAEEDKQKKELIEVKNQADQLVYSTEKTLKEHGDKVSAETRGNIENAVNNLKEAQKGDDKDAIQKSIEKLGEASQELGKILYEEAAKKQQAGNATQQAPKEDSSDKSDKGDVIDAEFEAKD